MSVTSNCASSLLSHRAVMASDILHSTRTANHTETGSYIHFQKNLAFSKSCDRGTRKSLPEVVFMIRTIAIIIIAILWLTTACFGQTGKAQNNLIPVKPGYDEPISERSCRQSG